jgi:hypothetical protein
MSELNNELQNDLAEAALLEPAPRGPGRPPGSKNKSTSRTEIRRRVQLHRQRKREQAEAAMEAAENSERLFRRLQERGFSLFGEVEPGVNAVSADEELMLAEEYAAALNLPGKRPEQTIRNFVHEVLKAWCSAGAHPFNRETKQFATEELEGVPDAEQYIVAGEDQLEAVA